MTAEFRYILEKGSRKHICPECGKKTLVRYQDTQTGEYLPVMYGRCDREIKCAYHKNPYSDRYGQDSGINTVLNSTVLPEKRTANKYDVTIIPHDVLFSTLSGYGQNIFIQNLLTNVSFPVDRKDIERVIGQYYLGTIQSGFMAGAVTFPFIDVQGRVMAIQVKQFDCNNHTTRTSFLHKIIENDMHSRGESIPEWLKKYNTNEKKVSCLFGEHLLGKYPSNPVALVEAPKSAIYAALYTGFLQRSKDLIWLAVYNLSSLTLEKCQVLKGRKVVLFPDLSKDGKAYRLWEQKASEFNESIPGAEFVVSDLIEKNAADTDRYKGLDLADYLIRMDWRSFRPKTIKPEVKVVLPATVTVEQGVNQVEIIESAPQTQSEVLLPEYQFNRFLHDRTKEWVVWPIEEIISFFDEASFPETAIQLDSGTQIIDVRKFITGQINVLNANNGNPVFKPYLDRLNKLKSITNYDNKNRNTKVV